MNHSLGTPVRATGCDIARGFVVRHRRLAGKVKGACSNEKPTSSPKKRHFI